MAIGRPRNEERIKQQQDEFLEAFGRIGLIQPACEAVGIFPPKHYNWLKSDPAYADRFQALKSEVEAKGIDKANQKPKGRPQGSKLTSGPIVEKRQAKKAEFLELLPISGRINETAKAVGLYGSQIVAWRDADVDFDASVRRILADTAEVARAATAEAKSRASIEAWADPEKRAAHAARVSEAWTPEMREAQAQRVRDRLSSPEAREAVAERSRQQWTEERKAEQAEQKRRQWQNPEYATKMRALVRTPEQRAKASAATKAYWESLAPEVKAEKIRNMRRVIKGGNSVTKIEAAVMMALNEQGLTYQLHLPIAGFVADVVVPSRNLVIEADGEWFHKDPERDTERDAILSAAGYRVVRLTEEEIKSGDFSKLVEALG